MVCPSISLENLCIDDLQAFLNHDFCGDVPLAC